MPAKVQIQVQQPGGTTKAFELTEHDTFLLGRMDYCHLCLPNDERVSRHRFLLEACPLQSSLRDLGSMNDTHVKPQILLSRAQAVTRATGEWIATAACHEVPHRQFVLTPPPFDIQTIEPIEPPWQAIKESLLEMVPTEPFAAIHVKAELCRVET
ncbi:MAG: hypothetical protein OSA84_08550, partial [Akkermansiaceae bacterium]|nr:hypothetical protein [Akkermansiaceae bacterium]